MIEQRQAVQVRHPDHVNVGIQQIDVQGFDFCRFRQGQRDVQTTDVMGLDQFQQVLLGTDDARCARLQGRKGAVADQAHQRQVFEVAQLVRQSQRQFTGADDQGFMLAFT
ncbi:hypothetical protein D3C75_1141860 [compost metagenome]